MLKKVETKSGVREVSSLNSGAQEIEEKMKVVAVYLMVATTFFLFLHFSPTSHQGLLHHPGRKHLGRHLRYKHAPFDPLIAKRERLMEERETSSGGSTLDFYTKLHGNPTTEDHSWDLISGQSELDREEEEEEEFEGSFNITRRLLTMFPLIDKDPKDGYISLKELENWNVQRAIERLNYKTAKEMKLRDEDGDGSLSLSECLHQFTLANLEEEDGHVGWSEEHFTNADADGNGFLNLAELNDFINPRDSENEEIQVWLLREKIRHKDDDKDGKLNFLEFHDHVYDNYKSHAEYEYHENYIPGPKQKFAELDLDNDKLLTAEELLPILHQLYPGEITYATYYAKYLIREVDADKDGKLTIQEMLNKEEIFYSKVFEEEFDGEQDDWDDYYFHDEF